jgi:hypothetical protein
VEYFAKPVKTLESEPKSHKNKEINSSAKPRWHASTLEGTKKTCKFRRSRRKAKKRVHSQKKSLFHLTTRKRNIKIKKKRKTRPRKRTKKSPKNKIRKIGKKENKKIPRRTRKRKR